MTITGFEEIQRAFEDVHENNRFEEPNINESYEVCVITGYSKASRAFSRNV